jgi:hypothetical protein
MQPPAQGQVAVGKKRFGCFAARIGTTHQHRLTQDLTLPSGRLLRAGQHIHLDVQDVTRHPEATKHATWVCLSPLCREVGKAKFASKGELLAAHLDQRVLEKQEEQHLFYAVAHIPGVDAKAEVRRKDGSIEVPASEAQLPKVMLLSDEE